MHNTLNTSETITPCAIETPVDEILSGDNQSRVLCARIFTTALLLMTGVGRCMLNPSHILRTRAEFDEFLWDRRQLHPPVQGPALFRLVGSHRSCEPESLGVKYRFGNALFDQILHHGIGPS